ncbi:hypothetical protein C8R43DRAFT_615500 [Mycena crocata]|nr:hypothetical protein C8R43DRAFT_615500 [Mycena crocata]
MEHTGVVPEVSMDFMYTSVLKYSISNTHPTLVDEVEAELINRGHLTDGRWTEYPKDPNSMDGTEEDVFLPLLPIFKTIIATIHQIYNRGRTKKGQGKTKSKIVHPTIEFKQNPYKSPQGERENGTRPDTAGVLTRAFLKPVVREFHTYSWFSIAVPGEFKKVDNEENALDNVRKTVWSAKHMLSNDPARRFVLCFTIEDAFMRVWFMSRSLVIASTKFNFISTPRELIRAIATFSYAGTENLGYDTTITQFTNKSNRIQYRIRLNGVTYLTIRPLSDHSADGIRGRATRVWLVHAEGIPEVHYVLKDVWVPSDSLTEGDQLRLLHDILRPMEVPDGTPHPSEYFLTVVNDGFVPLSDETDDDTFSMMGGGTVPPDANHVLLSRKSKETKTNRSHISRPTLRGSEQKPSETLRHKSHGLPPTPSIDPSSSHTNRTHYAPRKHYRIVFEQVGTLIYDLKSIREVLNVLVDVINALKVLNDLGLVHRDVSLGNILVFQGRGMLSDLEYMKVYREDLMMHGLGHRTVKLCAEPREAKTANMLFTSVEAQKNKYVFVPPERHNSATGEWEAIDQTQGPYQFFRHNPLHDMESTLWIAFWVITCGSVNAEGTLTLSQTDTWQKYFAPKPNTDRRLAIQNGDTFFPQDFPQEFLHVVRSLARLRFALHRQYTRFEATLDWENLDVDGMLKTFVKYYTEAATQSDDVRLYMPQPENPTVVAEPNKRTRSEAFDEDGDGENGTAEVAPTRQPRAKRVKSGVAPSVDVTNPSGSGARSTRSAQDGGSGARSKR